jgi:hypothetical protein
MFNDIEGTARKIEDVRAELCNIYKHKSDLPMLSKYKNLLLLNYKHFEILGKHFSFGEAKTSVNVKFGWTDSVSQEFKGSFSTKLESISSLYNLASCLNRIAAYMDLSGEGTKEASKLFQQSAWLFEHLKQEASHLQATDFSMDFSNENLTMLSNLMLGQAQYLFYRKAVENKMKGSLCAKVALQVSNYFGLAYKSSLMNKHLCNFDQGRFSKVLNYHEKYFEGVAWLH